MSIKLKLLFNASVISLRLYHLINDKISKSILSYSRRMYREFCAQCSREKKGGE